MSDRLSQLSSPLTKKLAGIGRLTQDTENAKPISVKTDDVDSAFIEGDSGSFIALSPVVHPDDYLFSLDDSEGISELFDINATALPNSQISDTKHPS